MNDREAEEGEAEAPRSRYTGATYMANVGITVFIDAARRIAHNKVIVVDAHLVIGGFCNYTASAERRNAENVTFIDNPVAAGWFPENWHERREMLREYRAGEERPTLDPVAMVAPQLITRCISPQLREPSSMSTPRRLLWTAILPLTAVAAAASFLPGARARVADPVRPLPAPLVDEVPDGSGPETIVLAGGCFWGVQGVFQHVRGVTEVMSGYDGGSATTAQYETVSTGTTGHAESVRITYDPHVVTTGQLLRIFFSVATDPTQRNQQYPDHGPQYRSVVFTTTPGQAKVAQAYIAQLDASRALPKPIATEVVQDTGFYPAEGYHQDYLTLHPSSPYIATFDLPKITALQQAFPDRFRSSPVLVVAQQS